jgi:hypothetical protein
MRPSPFLCPLLLPRSLSRAHRSRKPRAYPRAARGALAYPSRIEYLTHALGRHCRSNACWLTLQCTPVPLQLC